MTFIFLESFGEFTHKRTALITFITLFTFTKILLAISILIMTVNPCTLST